MKPCPYFQECPIAVERRSSKALGALAHERVQSLVRRARARL